MEKENAFAENGGPENEDQIQYLNKVSDLLSCLLVLLMCFMNE